LKISLFIQLHKAFFFIQKGAKRNQKSRQSWWHVHPAATHVKDAVQILFYRHHHQLNIWDSTGPFELLDYFICKTNTFCTATQIIVIVLSFIYTNVCT